MGFYGVFFGMHFLGIAGMPRRYFAFSKFDFLKPFENLNILITMAAFLLGAAQAVFLLNFFGSLARGAKAAANPWRAATLEWTAPSPPPHGNWGEQAPVVHRWAYDYSLPESSEDFTPQTVSTAEVKATM